MKKTFPYLALCLLLQGCVGAGIVKKHAETFRDAHIPEVACPALYSGALYEPGHYRPVSRPKPTNTVVCTSEWLEAHWGKPLTVTRAGPDTLDEIWTYKFGAVWEGVVPVVVIPIPIALPLAREKVEFLLHDGRLVNATQTLQRTVGKAYGLEIGGRHVSFGAFSLEGLLE